MLQSLHLSYSSLRDIVLVLCASIILALSAWIAIPLPFTPVPISLTPQLVLFLAVILGKRGAYATLLYVAQGASGLPVFANGNGGIAYLFGPTGGYLIGFMISAWMIGSLVEKGSEKTPAKIFGLMLLGNGLIYLFGLPHLALFTGMKNALKFGFSPFIAGDLLKLVFFQRSWKFLSSNP